MFGGEFLRKLKKYKSTKFKAKTSVYDKDHDRFCGDVYKPMSHKRYLVGQAL